MIVGGSKKEVIENIQKNILDGEFNKKVELDDPNLDDSKLDELINNFYEIRKNKLAFSIKSKIVNNEVEKINKEVNQNLSIEGLENLKDIQTGAIITSNHFNPLDSLPIREMIKTAFNKKLYIVTDAANLSLPGNLATIVNYLPNIPLKRTPNYIIKKFMPELKNILNNKNYVLIYPEEEMWFNYRKPRPCKRGAYQFAAETGMPVISCFVQIIDEKEDDNDEFCKVRYTVHVLKPIYPDKEKSVRTNSIEMAQKDYEQKKEAYEKAYQKKLDYKFSYSDIAGYKKDN